MNGWSEKDIPDLTGKRAVVTGAASGIGFHAARALAEHGADVIVADNNVPLAEKSADSIRRTGARGSAAAELLDLASLAAVRAFADAMLADGRPIDILVNNAGIQAIADRRTTADGFELTFGIGHLGHFLLTGALYPLVRAAGAPRIVTVSSMVHGGGTFDWDDLQMERGYSSQRAYNQTKLANLLFARELQRRIDAAGDAVLSMAVHPGVARTAIGANRHNLGKLKLSDHLVSATLALVMPLLGQNPDQGALPTLFAATSLDAQTGAFYGPSGFGEMKGAPGRALIKPAGQDMAAAFRLWQASEELTGMRFLD